MRAEARAPERGIYAASTQDELHDVALFMRVHIGDQQSGFQGPEPRALPLN
jgi:hypothetical protein